MINEWVATLIMRLGVAICLLLIICLIGMAFMHNTPLPMTTECIDMNGHEIEPELDLCRYSCESKSMSSHMQEHYDEICRCCNYRGVDYKDAGEYQPRVYVMNSDGSKGEDRTCAYYPDANGCRNKTEGSS